MILVKNRKLVIPREEFNIGTNYDNNSEVREFRINARSEGGVDVTNLMFRLDMTYANGNSDTAMLEKSYSADDKVLSLILTITNNMLQVPGTVIIQLRGLDTSGALKWTSYAGAFFVEEAINLPAHYTGTLTEFEQIEIAEESRVAAEKKRVEAENERAEAETIRNSNEEQREAELQKFKEQGAAELQEFKEQGATELQEFEEQGTAKLQDFDEKRQELIDYSIKSRSYAVGDTGTRENEEVDNAKYYAGICSVYADVIIPTFYVDPDTMELMQNELSEQLQFELNEDTVLSVSYK